MKKAYVIVVDDSYIRDSQILNIPKEVQKDSSEEKDWIGSKAEDDDNWGDYRPNSFLGFAYAENPEKAFKMYSDYSPVILRAIEIPNFGGTNQEKNN